MQLNFQEGDWRVEVRIGKRSIQRAQPDIEELRQRTGQASDVLTSPARVLASSVVWNELPVAVLMRRHGRLHGVAWLIYRRKYGVLVGLAKGGNLCGQGSVVAAAHERVAVLEATARVLLRNPLAHTVVVSTLWGERPATDDVVSIVGIKGQWHFRDVRFRLRLDGGLEATLERLGYKMRRNLRYYRRRAEAEFGCEFVPEMTREQRREAVAELLDKTAFPLGARRAWQIEANLQATPGACAVGLRHRDGGWLSYVAGWRSDEGIHVDWQLNRACHKQASLSTVMRAYLLQHEAARGTPAIVFVGLTSDFWSRACEADICGDLLATRSGRTGDLVRWLTRSFSSKGQVARLHARALTAQAATARLP